MARNRKNNDVLNTAGRTRGGSSKTSNQSNQRTGTDRNGNEFIKDDFWMNIGFNLEVVGEDGETTTEFFRLAKGIPLSAFERMTTYPNTSDKQKTRIARHNAIIDALHVQGDKLEDGEGKTVKLSVSMYKVQAEVSEDDASGDTKSAEELADELFG